MTPSVASGEFVAQHVDDGDVDEDAIQANGVDLGIDSMFRTSGQVHFFEDGYEKPHRTKIKPKRSPFEDGVKVYSIGTGQYSIVYDSVIEIPDGYVGRVYPRSRFMRSSLHITSALWDQGYKGVGEGLLQVPRSIERATIPTDMKVAQLSFIDAEDAEDYEGTHDEERLTMGA